MLAVHLPHPQNFASSSFIASSFISNEAESAVLTSQIELQTGTFNLAITGGSLFPDKVAGTCILQVSKADVTLPTPNNQPRSLALEKGGTNNA